jgi:hypothetical protein
MNEPTDGAPNADIEVPSTMAPADALNVVDSVSVSDVPFAKYSVTVPVPGAV